MSVPELNSNCLEHHLQGVEVALYSILPPPGSEHPTEKSLKLVMDWGSKVTDPGEVVLETFMGSGTTGLACAGLDRKFIGVAKRKDYFGLACQRIADVHWHPDMFAATGG